MLNQKRLPADDVVYPGDPLVSPVAAVGHQVDLTRRQAQLHADAAHGEGNLTATTGIGTLTHAHTPTQNASRTHTHTHTHAHSHTRTHARMRIRTRTRTRTRTHTRTPGTLPLLLCGLCGLVSPQEALVAGGVNGTNEQASLEPQVAGGDDLCGWHPCVLRAEPVLEAVKQVVHRRALPGGLVVFSPETPVGHRSAAPLAEGGARRGSRPPWRRADHPGVPYSPGAPPLPRALRSWARRPCQGRSAPGCSGALGPGALKLRRAPHAHVTKHAGGMTLRQKTNPTDTPTSPLF